MRFNPTERIGVKAIEQIVLEELNWIFREQSILDFGIDAHIETVINGFPTCKLIGVQIKSGLGNFHQSDKSFTYYTSDIHYNYWKGSNIPLILVAYIPEKKTAFWRSLTPENFVRTKQQWKIDVPKKQEFNGKSQKRLQALIDGDEFNFDDEEWTIERILELTEKTKMISKSKDYILEIAKCMEEFNLLQKSLLIKYNDLIKNSQLSSSIDSKRFSIEYSESLFINLKRIEKSTNNFSISFAEGTKAFHDLVKGCIYLNLINKLEEVYLMIKPFAKTTRSTIVSIEQLKSTLDRFDKKDRKIKENANKFADVLNLMIREYKVASEMIEEIVLEIEQTMNTKK